MEIKIFCQIVYENKLILQSLFYISLQLRYNYMYF